MRAEADALGKLNVPGKALYGIQTQRAILNFPSTQKKIIGDYPELIQGLMWCKQAAAQTNMKFGYLSSKRGRAIVRSAAEVLKKQVFGQFPVHYLHGGGGTSANMNANEVLANMAEERLGGKRGNYELVHPNDHVNLHQSTNDVYPTACHIAIILKWKALKTALEGLREALSGRGMELRGQKRVARTCLQDAQEVTFKDLLDGYGSFVKRSTSRLESAVDSLHSVNLGGSFIGRKDDVPGDYFEDIIPNLRAVTGDKRYRRARNLFDAAQNPDDMALCSAQLAILARGLIKIGQDFRLMASGPETGLGEIILASVQPGSSAVPGKVNPVIPEFLMQACFVAIGLDATCQAALCHGELDLNVWESAMVFSILDSMGLLAEAVSVFEKKCVRLFKVNAVINDRNANSFIPMLMRATHKFGYACIEQICREAAGDYDRIRKLLADRNLL